MALVAAACSSSGHPKAAGPSQTSGTTAPGQDKCTPDKAGGTLSFASLNETPGLDPTVSFGSGTFGGTELQALYDTLMRYDLASNKFVPWVAQSLTANSDYTQWTMKLRPGIKFGDGNPLTAQAVKASIARHQDPNNHSVVLSDTSQITDMQVVDDLTVMFKLAEPWGTFPSVLADLGGMSRGTTVIDKIGKSALNKARVGAGVGAFEFVRWSPGEELVMAAKKDYWGGPVCIQTLRFVHIPTEDGTYSALGLGEVQTAYTRDPQTVAKARAANLGSYSEGVGI